LQVRAAAVSLDTSTAISRTSSRGLTNDNFGRHHLFVMASLIFVAGLSFVPRNVALNAVLVFTGVTSEHRSVFASDVDLT
jgi:heme O synthase-like polyprenyltransferase